MTVVSVTSVVDLTDRADTSCLSSESRDCSKYVIGLNVVSAWKPTTIGCSKAGIVTPIRGHRPLVLRLPILVLYLAAFCLCIGLIERLLARTSPDAQDFMRSTTVERRDDTCPNDAY